MAVWDARIADGKVADGSVHWSARGAALLGLPAEPLVQPFAAFLACVHPDDRARVAAVMQDGADRRGPSSLDYRVIWPDATLHWLETRARVSCDAAGRPERTLGMVWDITGRKADEAKVAEARELARMTLASISDGIITADAHGKTRYLNRAAEQLTGWSARLAQGQDISTVLKLAEAGPGTPAAHVVSRCLSQRHATGAAPHSELLARDGRRFAVDMSAAPIWSHTGAMLGAVVVVRDISHQRSHERTPAARLSWQAARDALTGLISRRPFEQRVAAALDDARQDGHVHALLHLDLDRFKTVNDTCGHGAGDMLLQLLAPVLQKQMRASDILARLGGDAFGVLLPHCRPGQAHQVAEQICQAVRAFPFTWETRSVELGVSVGLVQINGDSKSISALLSAAEQACHLAKQLGGNRLHVYQEADQRLAARQGELLWVKRLNQAFEHQAFRLCALPIVHLRGGAEAHDEVLLRLDAGQGGLIRPGAFLPAAERYDLMGAIDRWVIGAVCRHIKDARDSLPALAAFEASHRRAPALFSVNLSGAALGDASLPRYITEQFVLYDIAPEQICFDISAPTACANLAQAQAFMAALKALGCRFSLDDFGAGLASFGYLQALPLDYLKIDGFFVRDIAVNPVHRAMVKAINEVGHVIGLATVAEYVEDAATLAAVRALGIDYAQGHAVGAERALTAGAD